MSTTQREAFLPCVRTRCKYSLCHTHIYKKEERRRSEGHERERGEQREKERDRWRRKKEEIDRENFTFYELKPLSTIYNLWRDKQGDFTFI